MVTKKTGQRNSSTLTCTKTLLTQNRFRALRTHIKSERSNWFIPVPVVTNSSLSQCTSSKHRVSATVVPVTSPRHSHSCFCTSGFETLQLLFLYLPPRPRFCGRYVLLSAKISMSNRLEKASRHRLHQVVQLSIGHPMGSFPLSLVSLTTSTSTSYHLGLLKNT